MDFSKTPELREIWSMKEDIKKRSETLERKLENARRAVYLPGSTLQSEKFVQKPKCWMSSSDENLSVHPPRIYAFKRLELKSKKSNEICDDDLIEKQCKIRSRAYDKMQMQDYMAKKRLERQKTSKNSELSAESIERPRHYDPEIIRQAITKRKIDQAKSKKLQLEENQREARILAQNLSSVLRDQKERRNVPLVQLFLNAKHANVTLMQADVTSREDFVKELKNKYSNFVTSSKHEANHHCRVRNSEKSSSEISAENKETMVCPTAENNSHSKLEPNCHFFTVPRLQLPLDSSDEDHNGAGGSSKVNRPAMAHRMLTLSHFAVDDDVSRPVRTTFRPIPASSAITTEVIVPPIELQLPSHFNETSATLHHESCTETSHSKCHVVPFKNRRGRSQSAVQRRKNLSSNRRVGEHFVGTTPQQRRTSTSSTFSEISADVDDEATPTAPPADPPPSISSLTLTSTPRRSLPLVGISCEKMTSPHAFNQQGFTPRTLHRQLVAGLDYLDAAQNSIKHCQDIDQTEAVVVTQSSFQRNINDRPNSADFEKLRSNLEQQRLVLEAQKALAEEKRSLFTENERRLLETLEFTNKKLLQQQTSWSSLSIENVAKVAAETAKAVTNAVFEDFTEVGSRIQALRSDLKQKKSLAEKLKREFKRRSSEKSKATEESLEKQLRVYDDYIKKKKNQLKDIEERGISFPGRPPISPRILSPSSSVCKISAEESDRTLTPRSNGLSSNWSGSKLSILSRSNGTEIVKNSSGSKNVARSDDQPKSKTLSTSGRKPLPNGHISHVEFHSSKSDAGLKSHGKVVSNVVTEVETTDEVSDVPEDIVDENGASELSHSNENSKVSKSNSSPFQLASDKDDFFDEKSENKNSKSLHRDIHVNRLLIHPDNLKVAIDEFCIDRLVDNLLGNCLNEEINIFTKIRRRNYSQKLNGSAIIDASKIVDRKSSIFEKSITTEQIEHVCHAMFDDFLDEILHDCCGIYKSMKKLHQNNLVQHKSSDRNSPRSPSLEKYVSESFRVPALSEKSPREIKKVDISALLDESSQSDHKIDSDPFGTCAISIFKALTPRKAQAFTTETFSAVPCGKTEICLLVDFCVKYLYEELPTKTSSTPAVVPSELYCMKITDADQSGLRCFTLSRDADEAYRNFVFDFCREIVNLVFEKPCDDNLRLQDESEYSSAAVQLFRKLKRAKPMKNLPEPFRQLRCDSENFASKLIGQNLCQWAETDLIGVANSAYSGRGKRVTRKKIDRIDEVLLAEIYAEENDWTDYEKDELMCKLRLANQIWLGLVDDSLQLTRKFSFKAR